MGWCVIGTTHVQPASHHLLRLAKDARVRGLDLRAAEGRVAIEVAIRDDDAEQTDAHAAHVDGVVVLHPLADVHVRADPRRLELVHALHELDRGDVVLVIAEHDVREADVVHAVDHPAPGVERREQ